MDDFGVTGATGATGANAAIEELPVTGATGATGATGEARLDPILPPSPDRSETTGPGHSLLVALDHIALGFEHMAANSPTLGYLRVVAENIRTEAARMRKAL